MFHRHLAVMAAGLALSLTVAIPAAAQSVQAAARANCMESINNRAGGSARFIRVSGGRSPIVEASAPGGVTYRCMTNASGRPVRVVRQSNS